MMTMILHITRRADWQNARETGAYAAESLAEQGFIHCSTPQQVTPVADFLFRGQRDLVLLCIAEQRLGAPVKYENLEGGEELFPHVYGPIDVKAVVDVLDFSPAADGTFALPPELNNSMGGQ